MSDSPLPKVIGQFPWRLVYILKILFAICIQYDLISFEQIIEKFWKIFLELK